MPWTHFEPWDRAAAERNNIVDMNVLAHRAAPDLRFAPDAPYFGDWDLLLKLTEGDDPLEVPVIAAYYTTTAPDRMSDSISLAERERQHRDVVGAVQRRRAARTVEADPDGDRSREREGRVAERPGPASPHGGA
jgi:hypothetical protein